MFVTKNVGVSHKVIGNIQEDKISDVGNKLINAGSKYAHFPHDPMLLRFSLEFSWNDPFSNFNFSYPGRISQHVQPTEANGNTCSRSCMA